VRDVVSYGQKISYTTAGPPLTPGGLITFMPHPNAMRLSSLYQGVCCVYVVRDQLCSRQFQGVPGLSNASDAEQHQQQQEQHIKQQQLQQQQQQQQQQHQAPTHPPPAAALLNLDLDDGIDSSDEPSSSSSSSSSASAAEDDW
jgi:hypothetical protein